ncbi:helix-turn-helix domain-containing protein [Gluconobacter thailandicus]|uniref:Helix-turn-helix domain-containing protein n=1 Tax=Gluconobacter thailandicus TaxID=257438 RepID=A0AAP9EVB9_GLUTH|nr:helix-turn-helix domain-containing protein [Gluconobacter thailandicus]QEH97769.1 helix-turn-helix domain-containing protein [Gluconobacter thailandicus]
MLMMDIAEAARRSGMAASTLRYYEDQGLIQSTGRKGLRRIFDNDILPRLALIALGRRAGFSVAEIGNMLGSDGPLHVDRDQLTTKADSIDQTIRHLAALRDGLRHAAVCTAPSHMECPRFKRLLQAALKPRLSRQTRVYRSASLQLVRPRAANRKPDVSAKT